MQTLKSHTFQMYTGTKFDTKLICLPTLNRLPYLLLYKLPPQNQREKKKV